MVLIFVILTETIALDLYGDVTDMDDVVVENVKGKHPILDISLQQSLR